MDKNVVLDMVTKSSFVHWEKKAYWTCQPKSSLSYSFDTVEIDTRPTAADNVHHELAVNRDNNLIALAWGLVKVKDFTDSWVRKYPDQNDASIHLLDLFYNGNLILRTRYAAVDCARAYVPLPNSKQTSVSMQHFQLIKLMNYIDNSELACCYFDSRFRTSGFSVVDAQ